MTLRSILICVLALTFGGSAAIGVSMLNSQRVATPMDGISVVVAGRDIPRGMVIFPDVLATRMFPKDAVPEGSITKMEDAIERVVLHSVVKDEPLLRGMLSDRHARGGLATLIPKGMRAFTIFTPHVATHVAGFVLPGNKVDVLLTMSNATAPGDRTGGGVTTTLLQNVEILAVDQRLDAPSENRMDTRNLQSVTLLVTPNQAAKLELGQNKGTLHLSLRNPEDSAAAQTQPATVSGLQFHQERPWSEQLKGVIEAMAKLKESKPALEPKPEPSGPPATLEIRTVRGTFSGIVPLEPLPAQSGQR